MTNNNTQDDKTPPVRKAKKGAWWKSLAPDAGQPAVGPAAVLAETSQSAQQTESAENPDTPASSPALSAPQPAEPLSAPAAPQPPEEPALPPAEPITSSPAPEFAAASEPAPAPASSVEATPIAEEVAEVIEPTATAVEPTPVPVIEALAAGEDSAFTPLSTDEPTIAAEVATDTTETENEAGKPEDQSATEETPTPAKKRRSRRGGKKRGKKGEATETAAESTEGEEGLVEPQIQEPVEADGEDDEDNDRVPDEPSDVPEKPVVYKLLINAEEPEECRLALVEDGRLESFHVTTSDREATKNNIYKGRIVSIEANLQAAFVDIGTGRNGFLPFNEIHPEYYKQDVNERVRGLITQQQWKKLKIEDVMQRGQEVLVQVVKEVTGNKGANMTTYLSLPGRFLVLMPGSDSAGISRKIVGEERRSLLRDIMSEFEIPEGIGYIIRTASAEITHSALEKDLQSLLSLWEEVKGRGQTMDAPALVYEEQDMVIRFLRDHFIPEIQEILVDTQESLENVNAFIDSLPAKQTQVKVRLHKGSKPIFNQFNIEEQIESIFKPQVPLPSGGSIVINPTEALVAIDVNSGRTSKNSDFDETIFLANMEAAAELARQLRLRDLGGLIVVDFIDMRNKKHIREVERQVKISMKRDKAKVDTSKISRFGLMQISRQKMGAPIEKGSYLTCEYCQGRGVVRSVETLALYYLRRIQTGITRKKVARIECRLPLEVAQYLLNKKRTELFELENKHRAKIDIIPRGEMKPTEHQIDFLEAESNR